MFLTIFYQAKKFYEKKMQTVYEGIFMFND